MSYVDDYLPICEEFEGRSATMYLDTAGLVTVGCGLMVPDAQFACGLPFVDAGGEPASAQRIAADYSLVKGMEPGHAAAFYMFPSSVELTQASIDELLRKAVLQFDQDLREDFVGYDGFPDGVKMALLDMEYNLGDRKLKGTYLQFDAAVDACHWAIAAEQCGRNVDQAAFAKRNAWTKAQFLSAL